MRTLAVVVVALLGCAVAVVPGSGPGAAPPGISGLFEPRLLASGFRMVRLQKEIDEVEQSIQNAKKIDPAGFLDELNARLDDIVGRYKHTTIIYRTLISS